MEVHYRRKTGTCIRKENRKRCRGGREQGNMQRRRRRSEKSAERKNYIRERCREVGD